jgi:hypothetical protein
MNHRHKIAIVAAATLAALTTNSAYGLTTELPDEDASVVSRFYRNGYTGGPLLARYRCCSEFRTAPSK